MNRQPQRSLQQESEARGEHGAHSMITAVTVSSITSEDQNAYLRDVMVSKVDGRNTWLCSALLDTGCMPSVISQPVACKAVDLELTTIEPSDSEPLEGIVVGEKVSVLGKTKLKFFIDGVPYRNSFLVVPGDDRYDMLLGAKFLERSRLLGANTNPAEPLAGRL